MKELEIINSALADTESEVYSVCQSELGVPDLEFGRILGNLAETLYFPGIRQVSYLRSSTGDPSIQIINLPIRIDRLQEERESILKTRDDLIKEAPESFRKITELNADIDQIDQKLEFYRYGTKNHPRGDSGISYWKKKSEA